MEKNTTTHVIIIVKAFMQTLQLKPKVSEIYLRDEQSRCGMSSNTEFIEVDYYAFTEFISVIKIFHQLILLKYNEKAITNSIKILFHF